MVLIVEYKNMEPASNHLKDFIVKKMSASTHKLLNDPYQIKVTLKQENENYITKIHCQKGKFSFKSDAISNDIYSSISIASNRIKGQLTKYKHMIEKRNFLSNGLYFNPTSPPKNASHCKYDLVSNDCF